MSFSSFASRVAFSAEGFGTPYAPSAPGCSSRGTRARPRPRATGASSEPPESREADTPEAAAPARRNPSAAAAFPGSVFNTVRNTRSASSLSPSARSASATASAASS